MRAIPQYWHITSRGGWSRAGRQSTVITAGNSSLSGRGCSSWKQETNDGCFPPSVAHGLRQIVSTRRVLSEALLARWSTYPRRYAAGLPKTPCVFNTSELLFAIVHRMVGWDLGQPLNPAKKRLIATLRDEIRQPHQQSLRLSIPREERLARVANALLDEVGNDRTLDDWAQLAGMARRTFMRAFSTQLGMAFGRWRQQARLFAALEMLAQKKSVTEVAIAVGYDSVSAFIEMFRTMLGTTPQRYLRGKSS